jgi:hypothetical protein
MLLMIPETCEDWLQTMLAPPQHALCDENVAWIQQELDDDEAGYVQHTRSEFLPTRLLDVEADAHTDSVRLIETTTMVTCPRYLALSYCWGDQSAAAQQLKTTSSTLRKHFDSLPPDRTTIIVHDAVKVARALHVRYLWIDALCIIQDDGEDWARESRVMGLVYTNAYATICALAASSCLEGFVIRNDPEVRIHFRSSLRPNVAGLLHIYRQQALDSVGDSNTALPDHFRYLDEEVSAWNSRAWVYQEEKLSKRKILFGKSRIHLALSDRQLTEGIDKSWASNDVLKPSSFHDEYRQFIQSGDMEILQNSWLTAVQLFSEKKISDKQDRFPAISGLARLMAVPLADTYVAGLWRNDLLRGLLWEREFESITPPASDHAPSSQLHYLRQITRPGSATYIGPSWSWPHGQTYQPRYTMTHKMPPDNGVRNHSLRSECMSLNAWSQPENLELNPFGRINDARLYVEARCLPLPSSLQPVLSGRMFVGQQATLGDGSIAICNLDWEGIGDKHEFMLQDVSMLLLASCIAYTPLIAERLQVLKRETPAQVQENLITEAAESYDTERIAWGLLIHPVEDDKFVRIGRFKVYPQHGGLRAFQGCEWKAVELI